MMKESKMGNVIRERLKSVVEVAGDNRRCEICEERIVKDEDDEYVSITNC